MASPLSSPARPRLQANCERGRRRNDSTRMRFLATSEVAPVATTTKYVLVRTTLKSPPAGPQHAVTHDGVRLRLCRERRVNVGEQHAPSLTPECGRRNRRNALHERVLAQRDCARRAGARHRRGFAAAPGRAHTPRRATVVLASAEALLGGASYLRRIQADGRRPSRSGG